MGWLGPSGGVSSAAANVLADWTNGASGAVARALKAKLGDVVSVKDFGAVGGGLGTTISAAGADLATIRTETGQAWLQSTDSMDLAAFYRAQAHAEDTGGKVRFPRDSYVFTGPGFVHSGVSIDLDGSTVTNTNSDDSRFVRSNRVFLFGILAREDFDRFSSQGWEQTADNISQDDLQITTLSGTMPSAGDVLLLRTDAESGSPTLPSYTTFNEVVAVNEDDVTLRWPIEKAIASPIIVNYSTIVTLKSALATGGEPHRYYAPLRASLRNGVLVSTDGPAFEVNGALDCDIDVQIRAPKGQAVYGNGWNRCRVRVAGTFGGEKAPVELSVGSALSAVDLDLRYSGDDDSSEDVVSGSYALVQLGEYAEQITVRGRLDAGDKPANSGITIPLANRCKIDLELIGRAITQQAIAFSSNAGTGNRVRGRYEISSLASHYALWSNGGGGDNWIEDAAFSGDQSTIHCMRFSGASLGGARNVLCPEGQLLIDAGASGNVVIASYIREGMASSGPNGSFVQIKTALGSWPEDDVIVAYNTTGSQLVRECYGRTITNTGATAIRTRTLPASAAGMYLKVYRDSADYALRIDPNGSETIGSGGAGKYLELQSDKAWAELRCLVASHWVLAVSSGTIAFEA